MSEMGLEGVDPLDFGGKEQAAVEGLRRVELRSEIQALQVAKSGDDSLQYARPDGPSLENRFSEERYLNGKLQTRASLQSGTVEGALQRERIVQARRADLVKVDKQLVFVRSRIVQDLERQPEWKGQRLEDFKSKLAEDPAAARKSLEGQVSEAFKWSEHQDSFRFLERERHVPAALEGIQEEAKLLSDELRIRRSVEEYVGLKVDDSNFPHIDRIQNDRFYSHNLHKVKRPLRVDPLTRDYVGARDEAIRKMEPTASLERRRSLAASIDAGGLRSMGRELDRNVVERVDTARARLGREMAVVDQRLRMSAADQGLMAMREASSSFRKSQGNGETVLQVRSSQAFERAQAKLKANAMGDGAVGPLRKSAEQLRAASLMKGTVANNPAKRQAVREAALGFRRAAAGIDPKLLKKLLMPSKLQLARRVVQGMRQGMSQAA